MSGHNHKFHIELPKDWADQSMFTFVGPNVGEVTHQLFLFIDENTGGIDLDEFADERIAMLAESDPSLEVLKREQETLPNGREIIDFVYRSVPTDGEMIFRRNVYMMIDEVGYTFSAMFSKKTLKTVAVEVMNIINTFEPGE